MIEFRLYTFVNFYLSSIQQGIQTAHVLGDMSEKYRYLTDDESLNSAINDFWDWNENHKTIITLNGGAAGDIKEKYYMLQDIAPMLYRPAAYDCFYEDHHSFDGTMTACGVIVPSFIYDSVSQNKLEYTNCNGFNPEIVGAYYYVDADGNITHMFSPYTAEAKLARMIKSCKLAQ